LELRIVFGTQPVGSGCSGERETVGDKFRRRDVWTAAEVFPDHFTFSVKVVIDGDFTGTDLNSGAFGFVVVLSV
jgi:hypothetical protein